MIHKDVIPRTSKPVSLKSSKNVKTLAGTMSTKEMVVLRDLRLPEFDKNRRIDEQKALIFEKNADMTSFRE